MQALILLLERMHTALHFVLSTSMHAVSLYLVLMCMQYALTNTISHAGCTLLTLLILCMHYSVFTLNTHATHRTVLILVFIFDSSVHK